MKEKILVITSGFYPTNSPRSFRSTQLVKELCRLGHDVTVMTHIEDTKVIDFANDIGFKLIDLGKRSFRPITSKLTYLNFLFRVLNRLLNLFFEYPEIEIFFQVKKVLNRPNEKYDRLISIAAPHPIHWAVAWSWNKKDPIARKWIADCGDPFYGNHVDTFRRPFYFKFIEKMWCEKCDFIAITHIALATSFLPEYLHKIVEIPQGYNLDEENKLVLEYIKNEIPTFAYAGSFVPIHRDPTEMLEWLIKYEKPFKFYIFTRNTAFVEKYVSLSDNRIILRDYINRNELISFLSLMDFNINFMYDPTRYAPSKIVDYFIAKRPILNIDYKLDETKAAQFLSGDYLNAFKPFEIDRFDIKFITQKFLNI